MKLLSHKTAIATAWALCLGGSLLPIGCGNGGEVGKPLPADTLATKDPEAKAKALLVDFDATGVDDRQAWIQQHEFDLAVFETVKDSEVLARYRKDIAPLRGAR